jgi:hypothetical protein
MVRVPLAVSSTLDVGSQFGPGLRVEWARAKARKERWTEEAILNTEEMRRNLAFSAWQRQRWLDIAAALHHDDPVTLEGQRAYALEQADYEVRLTRHCVTKWSPVVARARASKLLGALIIDPFPGVPIEPDSSASTSKGKAQAGVNDEPSVKLADGHGSTLELAVGDSEGLALSTADGEFDEPRCVCRATRH